MPEPESTGVPDWSSLERELRDLGGRVARIERELGIHAAQAVGTLNGGAAPAAAQAAPLPLPVGAWLPLVGRALLGLAGAYLLRTPTESSIVPAGAGVALGILYAMAWLAWAAHTPATRRFETALHSLTSVLILSPLLWEAALRFHAVSNRMAASVLLFFILFGLVISWRKNLLVVATISMLAGLATAAGLLVATHDVLPFTLVFLATGAAVEISACLDHWLSERWLAAAAADLSVLLATWLVTNPRGLPEAYAPIPPGALLGCQAALLAIYLASVIVRTLLRGNTITGFETAQCALAFIIGVGGGLRLSGEGSAIAGLSLACAAACYAVAFARLERSVSGGRNFYTYSTFGFLLALAGSRILCGDLAAGGVWPILAAAFVWAGGQFRRLTLRVHGGAFLLLAGLSSGALRRAMLCLLGAACPAGTRVNALWVSLAAAGACYMFALRREESEPGLAFRAYRLVLAGALALLAAGALACALTIAYHAAFGALASHAYCATLRTGVLTGSALVLAWAGARWKKAELKWLGYPAIALGAYRLLTQDVGQERTAALFLSLLLYGAALTAMPRLSRSPAIKAGL